MIAPGSTLSQRASTGPLTPRLAGPHNAHVAGAGVGNRKGLARMHLSEDEAQAVAVHLSRGWQGSTGLPEAPSEALLIELVQRAMRKAREIIALRSDPAAQDADRHAIKDL